MNSLNRESQAWAVKYRPKTLDEVILPGSVRRYFERYIQGGGRQPLILFGKPGTGKSLMTEILTNGERVFIDCRQNDALARIDRMLSAATSLTLEGDRRTIIIDDCESLSAAAKHRLREIENLTSINDFILTTNRINLVDEPLRSRLAEINFNFTLDDELKTQLCSRLEDICQKEALKPPEKPTLMFIIKKYYPDIRKLIGDLQHTMLLRED